MGMKKTEIGMIPEEWDVQSFSDTFRVLNNNTYSRAELNYDSGQFKNIHYGDVLILFPEVLDCTREDVPYINDGLRISSSAQPLQDGDVVMADTAEDETVGKVTEVTNTSDKPVMAGLHTIPFRVKSGKFVPKWLGYYMNSHLYHDQLLPYIHGTKVQSVNASVKHNTAGITLKKNLVPLCIGQHLGKEWFRFDFSKLHKVLKIDVDFLLLRDCLLLYTQVIPDEGTYIIFRANLDLIPVFLVIILLLLRR